MCLEADEPGTYFYTGVSHSFLPVLNRRYLVFIVARPVERTVERARVSRDTYQRNEFSRMAGVLRRAARAGYANRTCFLRNPSRDS